MRVRVDSAPKELAAAVIAMRKADKDIRRQINTSVRETFNPVWKQGLEQASASQPSLSRQVMLNGARIAAGNPPALIAGASKRAIKGTRVKPVDHWHAFEFGANRDSQTAYTRVSRRGKSHQVKRHTNRHLRPRNQSGYIAFPTLDELKPRIASFFIQSVIRSYMDALDRKN